MAPNDCQPCTIQNWPAFDFLLALSVACLLAMVWAAAGWVLCALSLRAVRAFSDYRERRLERLGESVRRRP